MGRILRWGLLQLCQSLVNGLYQQTLPTNSSAKEILHQGLKVEKLNSFSNFKFAVCDLCRISL